MGSRTPLRLSLIENAIDSLNESLSCVDQAADDPGRWKYAVLHGVHALELLLKHRLRMSHELLLWENVDRPGKTASLETAVQRLMRLGLGVVEKDRLTIERAKVWRNNITHYEVDLVLEEVREVYLLVFEFFDRFLSSELGESLSDRVRDEYLPTAAELMQDFTREMVFFRGREMHRRWPALLVAAQVITEMHLGELTFQRIPWGSEQHWHDGSMEGYEPLPYCRDCACAIGQLHGPICDQERCPRCGGQLISCDCDLESELWQLDGDEEEELTDSSVQEHL